VCIKFPHFAILVSVGHVQRLVYMAYTYVGYGVCKYYIGPIGRKYYIGSVSLMSATAAAAQSRPMGLGGRSAEGVGSGEGACHLPRLS